MANTLSHESTLLNSELDRFTLPTPTEGGKLTTSTVLWQQLTLDPIHVGAAALGYMSKTIHAHLVMYGEGAELIPGLAERWEVLDQGHVYRFHLRRGVRFHNGRTLEAKDVHDSLVRLLLPELNSQSGWIMREVRGAADVIEGRTRTLAGIQVRDQHTVDIILDEPLAFFLSLLTMHEAAIIPAEEARDPERFRLHPVGAGPFRWPRRPKASAFACSAIATTTSPAFRISTSWSSGSTCAASATSPRRFCAAKSTSRTACR